ncbi:MAG: endonuclease/exonuclease/phosphatase family protein [Rikenellaceae bacterium]
MKPKKIILPLLLILLTPPLWLLLTEWRPKIVEREIFDVQRVSLPDTLTLVSWNIGYAGLGEDMDFFYDGGTQTRTSREDSEQNMRAIISQLKSLGDVDFILLQEVDIHSKRGYYTNQLQQISEALNFEYVAFALNYNSQFVPIPIHNPMGRVKSGVAILSKYPFAQSVRWQYPSVPTLPTRLFDLKRAMLSIAIPTTRGDTLWVNNTHNSAFDDGDMRHSEIEFINNTISKMNHSITAGDWNTTPPTYTPSLASLTNEHFKPIPLTINEFAPNVTIAADISKESVRFLNTPYSPSQSITSMVDFAILDNKHLLLECKLLDLKFKNSDHNPVVITFLY